MSAPKSACPGTGKPAIRPPFRGALRGRVMCPHCTTFVRVAVGQATPPHEDIEEYSPQVKMWHLQELANTPDDSDLVRRWFQSLKPDKRGRLLVVVVDEVFAVGSTAAAEICRRHGYADEACSLYVRPPV